jgi:predicted Fe-Mo cluster-binding NifX family protein
MSDTGGVLRIAVASEDGRGLTGSVSAHFGRCSTYTIARVEGGKITDTEVVENPHAAQHVPGAVPQFLAGLKPDVVLAGGMGPRAVMMLRQFGIDVATGVSGTVEEAIAAWVSGAERGIVPCEHDHPESCGEH